MLTFKLENRKSKMKSLATHICITFEGISFLVFFLLSRKRSVISLSLYKSYKLIVYLGHPENPD